MKPRRIAAAFAAAAPVACLLPSQASMAAPGSFTLFDQIPQFGIYVSTPPDYTPPPGVVLANNGTTYLTKLTPAQKAMIGSDVAARITYLAQCDNYDRLGSLFMIVKKPGVAPTAEDPKIELVRWITPFSDYRQGQYATHDYPPAPLDPFSAAMRDPAHDVWIGLQGGSNPYDGDPCTNRDVDADFAAVGFKYTIGLSSSVPPKPGRAGALTPIPFENYTAVPIEGSAASPKSGEGIAIVTVSGHGSASGGDEYKHTIDTLSVNGNVVGSFDTKANCAPYRKYSPDGNPFIFLNNGGSNPRNWCPGALVPSYSFPVAVGAENAVTLDMDDPGVPEGSYYQTSVTIVPK